MCNVMSSVYPQAAYLSIMGYEMHNIYNLLQLLS